MRILHVSEVALGGVGTYISLIGAVARASDRHRAILPHAERCAVTGMPVTWYGREGGRLRRAAAMITALRKAIAEERPDLIYLHSSFAMVALPYLRLVARDIPVIYCAHGWARSRYASGWKAFVAGAVEGRLPALADAVVNISAHDKRLAAKHRYAGQQVLIENAVADPQVSGTGAETDDIRLLFVGRDARQKGLDMLRAAVAEVRCTRDDLHLTVVGDAQPKAQEHAHVEMVGWLNHEALSQAYAEADAVVMPSRWEGFGLVAAESFAHATPVLASRVGALPDIITPEVTGDLFAPDAGAIAACLRDLSKPKLRAMRPACRAAFDARFRPERFGRELHALFDAVVADRALPEKSR